MSTNQQNNKNEEEVDLGSLFKIIGKGFSNFFNFIGNIFKGIFHFLIIVLLFFKNNFLKVGIATIIGSLIGFGLDYNEEITFESVLLVEPNFNSTLQLYKNINYYNSLVTQNEKELLSSIFDLSLEESNSLRSFSIEAVENQNDIIDGYSKLVVSVDTLAIKKYPLEDYKNSFTKYDYKVHKIKAVSTDNHIFQKLEPAIINSIAKNTYLKNIKILENKNLERSYTVLKENLKSTDTLKKIYFKAILEEAKKPSSNTSIDMGGSKTNNKEIEIFSAINDINSRLNFININKAKKSNIVNVVSSFQKVGEKSGGIFSKKTILIGFFGFLSSVIILLLIKLNNYLEKYNN